MNEIAKVKKEVKLSKWAEMVRQRNESGLTVRQHRIYPDIQNGIKKNSRQEHRLVFNFRPQGALNQAVRDFLSARYRFANANMIFSLAVCFRRPRYRVFRYRNNRLTIAKTCSTLHLTDDFSCYLFLA